MVVHAMNKTFRKERESKRFSFLLVAAFLIGISVPAYAGFGSGVSVTSNSFSTATLEPPTGLSAAASCDGSNTARITINWTATSSTFADGYDIYRSSIEGGPYTQIDHVTGRTTTTQANSGLATSTTYFYVVQSTASSWTSVNSNQAQATTPSTCP